MGNVSYRKSMRYGQSSVTVVGLTHHYGNPQYLLVNSDGGDKVKFPGLRFRGGKAGQSLEDVAYERFYEQTGLNIRGLGLRTIMPTRSRHTEVGEDGSEGNPWIFRYVFFGVLGNLSHRDVKYLDRRLFVANVGRGATTAGIEAREVGHSKTKLDLEYLSPDNAEVAKVGTGLAQHLNGDRTDTSWYRKIPCVGVSQPLTDIDHRPLGCGLSVASMILTYRERVGSKLKVILLEKKQDEAHLTLPGYPGGKIETPDALSGECNIDPISCCMAEGAQELGFTVRATSIICCAHTPLHIPEGSSGEDYFVSLDNVAFTAEPMDPRIVADALRNPSRYLEKKMKGYVVLGMEEFRDIVDRGELRTPDMPAIGEEYFRTGPGEKPNLAHIRTTGMI